jgi:hypothetical protein
MQFKHQDDVTVSTFTLLTENNGLDHRIIVSSDLPNIYLSAGVLKQCNMSGRSKQRPSKRR